ncbi:MAG TPA: transporter substrate-binding domain-containing protein, partial [Actinomycetota bacterium]|nr:transporter substrate-binding domain-containing protein [Actinomycetota bacterium]
MKGAKVWLAALVAVFALVVASCADEDGGGETAATGPTTETGATGETGIPSFTTLEEGTLSVGSCLDYAPFESVKAGDEVGFDVDLTEEIASRLGLTVEWVRADFDTIFTAVAGDQFDMVAAASTITDEREQVVDFSVPYFNSLQSLTVNTAETPDITSTDQLGQGDVVGVQKGTTGKDWAIENLEPQGVQVKTFLLAPDAMRDLEAGNIVGAIVDKPAAVGIIADLPDLAVVQDIDTNEKYGFAFSPSNPDLREAVNTVFAQIVAD